MPRRPRPRPLVLLAVAALALVVLLRDGALAASFVRDAALGDEVEETLAPGDVHTWRVPLTAGTTMKGDARSEDDAATLTLILRAPDGSEVTRATGFRARIDTTVPATGTWVFEVSAAAPTVYDLHFEGEAGTGEDGGRTTVDVASGTAVAHLDVPRGAFVRIEVRRRAGGAPQVAAVRDALGRQLVVATRRRTASRVRLHALPVPGPGGLDVEVGAVGGGPGTFEVRAEIEDDGDDGPGGSTEDREDRSIVLTLAPGADPAAVVAALGPGYELEEVHDGFIVVRTPEGREGHEDEDATDADVRSDDVLGGEANALLRAPEGSPSNGVVVGSELGRAAFDTQLALGELRAAPAHALSTGDGIVVAILDSGLDATHPFFAGRVLPGADFVDDDALPDEVENGIDDDLDGVADEGFGHGTFVAGLVLGAAPDAKILPVRVLDTDARGSVSDIAAGIFWAVSHGAGVVNLSLEMPVRSAVLGDAVRYAIARGVVVVAASGNGGLTTGPSFPAAINGVVAVTATDPAGRLAPFGNGGPGTSVGAPGTDLVGPYPGDRWGTWSGTSFASAFVSGGAALLLEGRPGLLPAQAAQRIAVTARPAPRRLTVPQRRLLGAGRLDLLRLVR